MILIFKSQKKLLKILREPQKPKPQRLEIDRSKTENPAKINTKGN